MDTTKSYVHKPDHLRRAFRFNKNYLVVKSFALYLLLKGTNIGPNKKNTEDTNFYVP